jgi:hypothetical protein
MTTITQANPGIPHHIEVMVAEVLACHNPDPERRKAHRLQKLETFPESDRAAVREATNRVLKARNDQRSNRPHDTP